MEIFYLGQACFKIKTKEVTVIIDPFDPKFEADVVCVTQGMKGSKGINQSKGKEVFVIDGPGEYVVKGVTVFGIPAVSGPPASLREALRAGGKNDNQKEPMTIYSFEIEDFYLAHLGSIGAKLNDEQISEFEGVDILMVPVGGVTSIEQVAPSIVIPMLYSDSAEVKKFFEEMKVEAPEAVEKLKLKSRGDLPEEREIVKLKVQS